MHVKILYYTCIYNRVPEDEPSSSKHAKDIINKNINSENMQFLGLFFIFTLGNLSNSYFTAL